MSATDWLTRVLESDRLRLEVELHPAQGQRFQPTGYPDLGPATYRVPGGADGGDTQMLLVESPQSVANRLESVCWDTAAQDVVAPLQGLPYVRVELEGDGEGPGVTASLLEAHRLNSPYVMHGQIGGRAFEEILRAESSIPQRSKPKKGAPAQGESSDGEEAEDGAGVGIVDARKIAKAAFHYDPNAVLHGVFLTQLDGRARLTRILSGFIEAVNVREALSGGVKLDRVHAGGDTSQGYGNVPYARIEYVAQTIRAYFTLDVAMLRSYSLPQEAEVLLAVLALWKIRRFLRTGLRLRTACDLEIGPDGLRVTAPAGLDVPGEDDLEHRLRIAIANCAPHWASPPVTVLQRSIADGATAKAKKPKR